MDKASHPLRLPENCFKSRRKRLICIAMDDNPAFLDARGLLCPLPVLKARKRLMGLASGAQLQVLADDPAAVIDMPHFCAEQGHELLSTQEQDDATLYLIRKG